MKTIRRTFATALILSVLGLGAPAVYGAPDGGQAVRSNLHCC